MSQNDKTTKDLTTGNPSKLIFYFAIPLLLGTLFQQFYNMADTVIVGRTLGVNALAAVGATGSLVWCTMGAVQGITTGFSAVTAQHFGAGNTEKIKQSFAQGIILTIIFTAILTFVSLKFIYPLLELLQTPDDIIDDAYAYIRWILIGLFATALFNNMSNIIRSLGDSKTPLIFLIIASLVNIVLDFVFIIYGKMGPAGAGLATFLAQLFSGILCVIYIWVKLPILHFSLKHLKPEAKMMIHLIQLGVPIAMLNMVLSVGGIIIQFVNNGLGTLYVAIYSSATKIEQFIVQPALSFGTALSVFVAQNYGAKKYDRIIKGSNACMFMAYMLAFVTAVVIIAFGKKFMYMVAGGESTELIIKGHYYLIVNSILTIILVPLIMFKCALQAVGRTFVPMLSGFAEIGCRAGASIYLSKLFGFTGVCYANPIAWFGGFLVVIFDYILWISKLKKEMQSTKTVDCTAKLYK